MMIEYALNEFFNYIRECDVDIYNEFSLQHELGIYLREHLPDYKVQFERNVSFFAVNGSTAKKEIDIVVYNSDKSEKYAIELKAPRNGQYPEQMYSFVKDIKFMEQLKNMGFTSTYAIAHVIDSLFCVGNSNRGIYSYFRGANPIQGEVYKPTGNTKESILLNGRYTIKWIALDNNARYYIVQI